MTRYGLIEINQPRIYDTPIENRKLARVDTIVSLSDVIGVSTLPIRPYLYGIVSGNMCDQDIRTALCTFYRVYPKFREFVNTIAHYYDTGEELFNRVLSQLLHIYRDSYEKVTTSFSDVYAKELLQTHGYVYYSLHKVTNLPNVKGVKII